MAERHKLEGEQFTDMPLAALARRDGVVFIVVDREIANSRRDWSEPVQIRIERDRFDSRLRHLALRPVRRSR